jgi:hypothetical protein
MIHSEGFFFVYYDYDKLRLFLKRIPFISKNSIFPKFVEHLFQVELTLIYMFNHSFQSTLFLNLTV